MYNKRRAHYAKVASLAKGGTMKFGEARLTDER